MPRISPGQVVQGRVIARLHDGDYAVSVGGQTLRMGLPARFRAGDLLELVLVGTEPQLTFALAAQYPSAAGATVSEAGRLAATLAAPSGEPTWAAALTHATPLAAAPDAPAELAQALQRSVERSGLFYESHQAQWVAGERTLEQLLLEPQTRLAPAIAPGAPAGKPGTHTHASPLAPGVSSGNPIVEAHALPLVQQQLAALDTHAILWRGPIWPGQWLDWAVEERPAEAREPDDPVAWHTALRLHLPRLGGISASLALATNGVRVTLRADWESTSAELRARGLELGAGLAGGGIALLELSVKHHAEA